MRKLDRQRRRVVVLAALVMCLCAVGPLLGLGPLGVMLSWAGCMVVGLVYVLVRFKKLKSTPDA